MNLVSAALSLAGIQLLATFNALGLLRALSPSDTCAFYLFIPCAMHTPLRLKKIGPVLRAVGPLGPSTVPGLLQASGPEHLCQVPSIQQQPRFVPTALTFQLQNNMSDDKSYEQSHTVVSYVCWGRGGLDVKAAGGASGDPGAEPGSFSSHGACGCHVSSKPLLMS